MLDSRLWGSTESPLRLRFSIACLRLDAHTDTVEEWLERLQALSLRAREAGGARCQFDLSSPTLVAGADPQPRQLRALLGANSLADAAHFLFQPILQLAGYLTGQYAARMSVVPSKLAGELTLDETQYLQLARGLNQLAQAERLYVRALLELARAREAGHRNLRIHLPIGVSTALDPTFAPWLAAELGVHSISAGLLVLRLNGQHVHAQLAQARPLLESLQRLGLRLGIDLCDEGSKVIHELLQVESINVVNFRRTEDADAKWSERAAMVSEARSLGKTVLASGVRDVDELGVVLRLGAHYVQADALAGWSAEWNFEFAAIA
jgi:EAL domain-containing protein (putative c-di-GMP-specific phosphodiesterase class I)